MSAGPRTRLASELACLALAAAPLAPLAPGRSFVGGDLLPLFLPLLAGVQRALEAGALHTWDPLLFGGYPALAALQAGSLYPPHLLLLAPFPLLTALALSFLLHAWLLARGALFLVGELGGSRRAGLLAAASLLLGGSTAGHVGHLTVFVTLAWAPWVLGLAARVALREGAAAWGAALLLAAVQGVALLEPSPQWTAYLVVGALAAAAALAPDRRRAAVAVGRVGAALALAGLLAAPQLLPGAELLWRVPRLHAADWAAQAARGVRLDELPAWLLGDPNGASAELLLPGAAVWGLASLRLCGPRRGRDPLARAGLALCGCGLLLAQGWLAPLTPLGAFRLPVRALWLVQVGLALLAASGLDALLRGPDPRHARRALLVWTALLGLALLARALLGQPWGAGLLGVAAGFAALAAGLRSPARRARRGWAALACLCLLLELLHAWRAANPTAPDAALLTPPPLAAPIARSADHLTLEFTAHQGLAPLRQLARLRRNGGTRFGVEYLSAYETLPPPVQEVLVERLRRAASAGAPDFAAACAALSVRWVVLDWPGPAPPGLVRVGLDPQAGAALFAVPDARPRCYLLERGAARPVGFRRPWPGGLELEPLRLERPARLVLPVAFWVDWTVTVDGQELAGEELPLEQGLYLALELGPGPHQVSARFESLTLAIGLRLAAAGWVAWGAALWWLKRRAPVRPARQVA